MTASGEQLAADAAPHVLYGRYADSWRITSAPSKFTYAAGQDTATFTDASFPSQVTTWPISTVELDAASDTCRANHVSEGPAFDDCVYDLVSTGDDQYVKAAAAVSDTVVDPSQPSFNDDGELVEDFGPPVASAFAYSRYLDDPSTSRWRHRFDGDGYGSALVGIPRHDVATMRVDLLTFGSTETDDQTQSVDVRVDDHAPITVDLEGDHPAVRGSSTATAQFARAGETAEGTPFRVYTLAVPSTHSSTTLKVKLQTHNFHGLTGTSLGVDNIDVTLDAAPAQIFAASLPLSIASGSLGAGSGVLETPGAGDFYDFQLTKQQAAKGLVLESECSTAGWVKLRDLASGRILSPEFTSCSSARYSGLTDGPFRLEVISNGAAGAYHASVFVQPDAESFDYSLGHKVEPGKIGGVDVVGAGKLETSASKDVYTFTVPEGGQRVVFDADQYSWPLYYGSKLVQVSDGKNWGTQRTPRFRPACRGLPDRGGASG